MLARAAAPVSRFLLPSPRLRSSFAHVAPAILEQLALSADPDAALDRFERMTRGVGAREVLYAQLLDEAGGNTDVAIDAAETLLSAIHGERDVEPDELDQAISKLGYGFFLAEAALTYDRLVGAGTLALVSKKLDEVMDSKNQLIKALQYDVAKVSKAHNDLIRVYEAKLAEFGVPVDELGFRPLVTNTNTGPAGLVVGA